MMALGVISGALIHASLLWALVSPELLRPWLEDAPLNTIPFLMTHDCGTGYLEPSSLVSDIVYRFTKTQGGNITNQLDCGARAFDWRPSLSPDGSSLGFAHGSVFVNASMEAAAHEVVVWSNAHAAEEEDGLVLLIVLDCGDNCNSRTEAALVRAGVRVVSGDGCAIASDYTLGAAMAAAALSGGGHALALVGCPGAPQVTYDDRCSCTGFTNITAGEAFEASAAQCLTAPSPEEARACLVAITGILDTPAHYACYLDSGGKGAATAFDRLLAWDAAVASVPPPSGDGERGLLVGFMGCWAQNVQSTVLSFLHDSSLLQDEARANFNQGALLRWIADDGNATHAPLLQHLNLVGVNNVCNGGPSLVRALRKRLEPGSWRPHVPRVGGV